MGSRPTKTKQKHNLYMNFTTTYLYCNIINCLCVCEVSEWNYTSPKEIAFIVRCLDNCHVANAPKKYIDY